MEVEEKVEEKQIKVGGKGRVGRKNHDLHFVPCVPIKHRRRCTTPAAVITIQIKYDVDLYLPAVVCSLQDDAAISSTRKRHA
jgi:hypothetical protein